MTGRERALQTLNHREPDGVPLDVGGTVDTGIHHAAYCPLLEDLGMVNLVRSVEESLYFDIATGVVEIDEVVLQALDADTRGLMPSSSFRWHDAVIREEEREVIHGRLGATWTRSQNGYYFDQQPGGHPLTDVHSWDVLDNVTWPTFSTEEWCAPARERLPVWRDQYATLVGDLFGGILAPGFRMRGYTRFYTDLVRDPTFACGLMDRFVDLKVAYWEAMLDGIGEFVDIVVYEDDLGQQDRTLLSPDMYRSLVKPRLKRLFDRIKRLGAPNLRFLMHSDGSVYDILLDLIEAGDDILNLLQVSATGMAGPGRSSVDSAKDLVFWGSGADSQGVLSFGNPDQVRHEVRAHIDALAPGGGYVFSSIHNIQPEVAPENIEAMLEALARYGGYWPPARPSLGRSRISRCG